jgi:MOSC domain-containing protein YiiM
VTRTFGSGPAAASVAIVVGRVESVNVGRPRTVEWFGRSVLTSIWKQPVVGRVRAEGVNLAGDAQADLRVHGGPEKSVYVYSVEDYAWWANELGTAIEPGTFGENLTVSGIDCSAVREGDVWRIGTATFVATQPRQPCFKLGIRMNDAGFVQRFGDANRLGIYLRIAGAGDVGAGDAITIGASA